MMLDAASGYVQVARHVRDLGDNRTQDAAMRAFFRDLRPDGGATLETLLAAESLDPVVLVAPSGSGKSTELREIAKRLRTLGRAAVFAEATGVLQPNAMDLDPDEQAALTVLLARETPGVLFVDALDELHIRNHTVEQLFRRLAREIDFATHPIRLVFSARNGAWTPASTRELRRLVRRFGVSDLKLVTFEPLDLGAIRKIAEASGVTDVDAFVEEFEREEIADLLELRPTDVKLLARMHARGESLARWSHLLSQYIDASLVEERPDRARSQRLSAEAGLLGLQRVAAATMLMRVPHVATPTVAMLDGALSSRRLFADWPPPELAELFENALFVHKGRDAEAVQLPQGPLSHFLAARWLSTRVRLGLETEDLRAAVMTRVPGEDRFEVPSSRSTIVGWLASEVPEVRSLIASDRPDIVLYGGDPDRLSDAELRGAVRGLCEAIAAGRWDGWPTPATARRVARRAIEPEVRDLLDRFLLVPKVTQQLLRFVEHGRYGSCADLALALAAWSTDSLVRALAVAAFAAAAPEKRNLLLNLTGGTDAYVRLALLRALVPEILNGPPLVSFLLIGGGHAVRGGLAEVGAKVSVSDLDAVLAAVLPVLSSATVSAATQAAFDVAVPALLARLKCGDAVPPTAVDVLAMIERHEHDHVGMNLGRSDEQAFNKLLKGRSDVRRALWARRFAQAALPDGAFDLLTNLRFGKLESTDVEWLWERSRERAADRLSHPLFVLESYWSGLSAAHRGEVLASVVDPELAGHLCGLTFRIQEMSSRRAEREDVERRKDERTRAENETALAQRRSAIESGDDIDALLWAWRHLDGPGAEQGKLSPDRLRRYVGNEYVTVFLNGLRAAWRRFDPPLPTPGGGKPFRCLLGLTGVSLAVRAGVDVSTLTLEDARRAARLGLFELNAFPFWFGDLARVHPSEVRAVLSDSLRLEWAFEKENHGVLRLADRSDAEVAHIMRTVVLELLEERAPAHPKTLEYAVDAILTSTSERPRVLAVLRRAIDGAGATMPDANWLRLWAHVEPEAAADWLENRVSGNAATMATLLKVAALLEQDLDERFGRTAATWLMAPRALGRWSTLLLSFVKPSDDVRHQGAYSPGDREHAEDLRNRCLTRLSTIPTPEASAVLAEMYSTAVLAPARRMIEGLIKQQHALLVEASVARWTEEDVLRLERRDEKLPRTLEELFHLVIAHIRHVHRLVANDDFSYRDLFKPRGADQEPTKERELQLWTASCLRERARGLYSVVRENVVDDDKEVDISAFSAGVGHVPVEIKPLGDYSVADLERILQNQLLGQYMQPPDRRYGVLLLVRRDERQWLLGGALVSFDVLVEHLREHARGLGAARGKEIHVSVIDLLATPQGGAAPAAKAPTPSGSATHSLGSTAPANQSRKKGAPKRASGSASPTSQRKKRSKEPDSGR